MKHSFERKASYRSYWISQNDNTWCTSKHAYLKGEWNKANQLVSDGLEPVVLLKGLDEQGTLVPPHFLYAFHLKNPDTRGVDPVLHLDVKDFRRNFDLYASRVNQGLNYIIVKDGKPYVSLVSEMFRGALELKPSGELDFNDLYFDLIYDMPVPRPNKIKKETDFSFPEEMRPKDFTDTENLSAGELYWPKSEISILERALENLKHVKPSDRTEFRSAVQNLSIYLNL